MLRKNAAKESMTNSRVLTTKDKCTGLKLIIPLIHPIPCNKTAIPW
jgi:hypothetical protein